jgi:hypothetical protein
MTRQRVLLVITFFIVGVVMVWLPYRIHIAKYATDLRFIALSILVALCLFTTAVFIALGAPERVRAIKKWPRPLAYLYSREIEAEALQAKMLTEDEARRVAVNIARLPELLGKGEREWSRCGRRAMDADVERFLAEIRTIFAPAESDAAERVLRGWYQKADGSREWQETWDRLREAINPPSKPIRERLVNVIPLLQAMLPGNWLANWEQQRQRRRSGLFCDRRKGGERLDELGEITVAVGLRARS